MTIPTFRAVDQQTGTVVTPPESLMNCPALIPDALLAEINSLRLQLEEASAESANIAALFAETERHNGRLATELAHALSDRNDVLDRLHDMRETCDMWAERAEEAERALTKFQDQAVRIQELETALSAAQSERNTYRAAVSAVPR